MLLLGAVLAGGRSSRFGSDKALTIIDGEPLIERVLVRLRPQVSRLIICGRTYAPHPSVPDRPRPNAGPLGGLNAALHVASDEGYDAVISIGCDTPDLPADLVDRLVGERPAALRSAPIIGFWPATLASALDRHLAHETDRSMARWIKATNARLVDLDRELPNINTLDDLAAFTGR